MELGLKTAWSFDEMANSAIKPPPHINKSKENIVIETKAILSHIGAAMMAEQNGLHDSMY